MNSEPPNESGDFDSLCRWAEDEVETLLSGLPDSLKKQALTLPITLEPVPSVALQSDGIAPETLGLFTGSEFADEGHVVMPPQIILFIDNLWDYCGRTESPFRKEVRKTLLHELGHYLGLDEADLIERGLE